MSGLLTKTSDGRRFRFSAPWLLFAVSASLIPLWWCIGGLLCLPDARSLADGPGGSWYRPWSVPVHLFSFFGCTYAPFLSSESLQRKVTLGVAGAFAFLADELVSAMFTVVIFGLVD